MPHDIIDNQEQKLADHIGRLLDNSERAKFAVGYDRHPPYGRIV